MYIVYICIKPVPLRLNSKCLSVCSAALWVYLSGASFTVLTCSKCPNLRLCWPRLRPWLTPQHPPASTCLQDHVCTKFYEIISYSSLLIWHHTADFDLLNGPTSASVYFHFQLPSHLRYRFYLRPAIHVI